ncbi:MAG: isochorismatase family protein, partial [Nitrososphaerales archaeon]
DVNSFSRYPKPQREFGENPALLVVDMTHAFVDDKYPFGFSKTGLPCVKAIKDLLDVARPLSVPVFYTKNDRGSWAIERIAEPSSTRSQALGSLDARSNEIVEDIAPREGEIVIEKVAPSGFAGTPLVALLNRIRVDTVIVTGMVTSGCVRATAVDAFAYKYKTFVPIECSADRSQISHKVSLFDLSMKYANVLPLSEVLQNLRILKGEVIKESV